MRINNNNPVSGLQARRAKKQTSGSSQTFQPETAGDETTAQSVSAAGGIQGMDALLALQEVDTSARRSEAAMRHGHGLLDNLEWLRADLLAGHVPEDRLELLAETVDAGVQSGDPGIDSVLKEIELRVKVELAKLGRFSR
ncbi:flagellar assembly regulator FliX [Roseibium sp. RKSG952]|nr:flagellar assembly regulator FliX [Roseibium sp. RKSG952]